MVGTAKLLHQASSLSKASASLSISDRYEEMASLRRLLEEAQILDDALVIWANDLPTENWYSTKTVQDDGRAETGNKIFEGTVHVYPTVGHAGMWNRLLDVSEIVDDGVLERIAAGFSPMLQRSANIP